MKISINKLLQHISDEELERAWSKIRNNPGKTIQILLEKEGSILYDLFLTLYQRNFIKSADWAVIAPYMDCTVLFNGLIQDERTKNQFKSDISDLFDRIIRDSKDFWQDHWEEPFPDPDYLPRFSFAPDRVDTPVAPEHTPDSYPTAPEPIDTRPRSGSAHNQFSMWKLQHVPPTLA